MCPNFYTDVSIGFDMAFFLSTIFYRVVFCGKAGFGPVAAGGAS